MTREAVVAEALSWEGTPYHPNAAIKGIGADCAMFPLAAYQAVGLVPAGIKPTYTAQWMMHRDEEQFLEWVRQFGREIDRETVLPGDFAIWKVGRCYAHGAIVIDLPEVIHAVIAGNAVVRANIDRDEDLMSRPVKFFTLF